MRGAILLFFFLFLIFLSSCATKTTKPPSYKQIPPPAEKGSEVSRPAKVSDVSSDTPKRNASMQLVEKGRAFLDAGEFDRATDAFRDSINIDSTNGFAYYFLAEAYLGAKSPDLADGALDRADALLGSDNEWSEKIAKLRQKITDSPRDGF